MSIWPAMVDRLTSCPVGRTLLLSMVTYVALMLFQVWTVAYNFVPGGEYTREHTDWLCGFIAVTLSLGLQACKSNVHIKDAKFGVFHDCPHVSWVESGINTEIAEHVQLFCLFPCLLPLTSQLGVVSCSPFYALDMKINDFFAEDEYLGIL